MRKFCLVLLVAACTSAYGWAQAAPAAAQPKKPAGAAPVKPTAVIETSSGKLTCILFPDRAPIGVANFVGLARGTKDWTNPVNNKKEHGVPLYNGTIFHRVIPEFMIQGGDPKGDGTGDPGYKFKNETASDLAFDQPGRLAYANAGPDTNGSQFFITEVAYPSLNGGYTIFGQCDEASVALVKQIARMPRGVDDRPSSPVKIVRIVVTGLPHRTATRASTTASKPAPPAAKAPAQ
jgi:peptidyl-prolyl cis-trans isomerase A (cyclophilin A)